MLFLVLGTKPPDPFPDKGAGAYCSKTKTQDILLKKGHLQALLFGAEITYGVEPVKHMRHYLANTGQDLHVDVTDYMRKSQQLAKIYSDELELTKMFVEKLPPGEHSITSSEVAVSEFNSTTERALHLAIGKYKFWVQATASINNTQPKTYECKMNFSFHFYDRYNWDVEAQPGKPHGKTTEIFGIEVEDKTMAEFHLRCVAKEYDIKGLVEEKISWSYMSSS